MSDAADWKKELRDFLSHSGTSAARKQEERRRIKGFIADVVVPAFEEVAKELQALGRDVEVEFGDRVASIIVVHEGEEEIHYEVRARAYRKRDFAFPAIPLFDAEGQTYRAEAYVGSRELHHDVTDFSREDLIRSFLDQYERQLRWER